MKEIQDVLRDYGYYGKNWNEHGPDGPAITSRNDMSLFVKKLWNLSDGEEPYFKYPLDANKAFWAYYATTEQKLDRIAAPFAVFGGGAIMAGSAIAAYRSPMGGGSKTIAPFQIGYSVFTWGLNQMGIQTPEWIDAWMDALGQSTQLVGTP